MTAERWSQIEKFYHAAMERTAGERTAFLAQACGGDVELRREVESLLAQEEKTASMLAAPAMELAARVIASEETMSLAGKQLGSYQVMAQIGAGGMGEVYRARDTKLGREVAIKVLPPEFVSDSERLSRFRREAKLLASLNHPNIATIHGLEDSGDIHFLVMELVGGETLATRVASGLVPVTDALKIGQQVAEALEHAHERKVIHRDLKPANVILTKAGRVKVLDFGLAKAFADEHLDSSDAPTLSVLPTEVGRIMGTPAYMSPEQAQGKQVDKQTDIWAFGCVLYELLTGQRAFPGDNISQTIAAVLKAEPDWNALPPATPPSIQRLLRRCLQKDANRRFHSAADIALEIEEGDSISGVAGKSQSIQQTQRWQVAAMLGVTVVLAGLATWLLKPAPQAPPKSVVRTVITVPASEAVGTWGCPTVALSPDGTYLAYVTTGANATRRKLYLRRMGAFEARTVPGIQQTVDSPFFSPDGQWLAFWADGNLKKVATSGGTPITLTKADTFCGGSWGTGDVIIYGTIGGLMQVSAAGGSPQAVTKADAQQSEAWHALPQLLPGGKSVLFTTVTSAISDTTQVVAKRLDTGELKVLLQGGGRAQYAPTGHLVYNQEGALLAAPFDLDRLELTGTPVPVVESVLSSVPFGTSYLSYIAQFSFSDQGALVYLPGSAAGEVENTLVWMDRKGAVTSLPAPPRPYDDPSLSPDGQRVAIEISADIWVYDISRNTLTPITHQGTDGWPLWSPDGKRVVFQSEKDGTANLFWTAADGSGAQERLATSEEEQGPNSWTPDGQSLIFQQSTRAAFDLWVLPLTGDREARPFHSTQFDAGGGKVSPDGRWIAYFSNESGHNEVYVEPFPGTGGKRQISTDVGFEPAWARSGRELFYRNGNNMMAVDVTTGASFTAGNPRLLFEGRFIGGIRTYDVAPDGQRFLVVRPSEQEAAATQINVVLNWFEELKQKVPTGK